MEIRPILGEYFAKLNPSVKIDPCKENMCEKCLQVCNKRRDKDVTSVVR